MSCRALKIPLPKRGVGALSFESKQKSVGSAKFGGGVLVLGQNRCGFVPPLVSIPSTALPETWLSFPSRIRDVFMFRGLSGNLKPGEFGQGQALAGTGL